MNAKNTRAVAPGKTLGESVSQNSARDCKRRFQRLNLMRPKIVTTYRINPQIWVKHWMENTQRESSRIFETSSCTKSAH